MIQRLQVWAENDAHATTMVRQQAENINFARQLPELTLAAKHTLQSVLEVKECQTAILLMSIRQDMFAGSDRPFVCQEEMLNFCTTDIASEWQTWASEESKYVPGYRYEWTGLSYMQTETSQPAHHAGVISGILKTPCQPPTSFSFSGRWA